MVIWLIILPVLGGVLAWIAGRWSALAARWTALLALGLQLLLALGLGWQYRQQVLLPGRGPWFAEVNVPWIPQLGISFHLAVDGLSLLLLLLTAFLGVLSVAASWRSIQQRVGFFHFVLLLVLAGITGVFLAIDLFLFYLCWELMIIPLYFLIDLWGYERRHAAAVKFVIFTQAGGLFLLLGILGLVFAHGAATGVYTFDYFALLRTTLPAGPGGWLMLAFFIAFAVKLPVVPLHPWLPDAHTQAPTAGSVDLAGLVLKVGAFGLLRFTVPLFPEESLAFAPIPMALGVAGILYGALLAFGQVDLKRLIAYTSISHMGYVLLGVYAWNALALQGVTVILIAHGLSTSALFLLVGAIDRRLHTRNLGEMGGMWTHWPRLSGFGLFFVLATLGLPGLANFVGEFLVLLGVFRAAPVFAVIACAGLIASVTYSMLLVRRVFWGPAAKARTEPDLTPRETAMLLPCAVLLLWLGLAPGTLLSTAAPALRGLLTRDTQQAHQSPAHPAAWQAPAGRRP